MVAATIVVAVFDLPGVATIESTFGEIPRALPKLQVPEMGFDRIMLLLPSAFTIAMLGAIESLLSAVVADGMAGTRHDSNQELIGQGVANKIGRASWRERVCQYVWISVVAGSLNKKKTKTK